MSESTNSKVEIEFRLERPTKNTIRYEEVVASNAAPKIGVLYIQKHTGISCERIRVTIEKV